MTVVLTDRDPNVLVTKEASEAPKQQTRKRKNAALNENGSDASKPTKRRQKAKTKAVSFEESDAEPTDDASAQSKPKKRRRATTSKSKGKGKASANALEEPKADDDENGASGLDYEFEAGYDSTAEGTESDPEIRRLADENTLCLSESELEIEEDYDDEIAGLLTTVDDIPNTPGQPEAANAIDNVDDVTGADDERAYPLLYIRLLTIIGVLIAWAKDFFKQSSDGTLGIGVESPPMTRHWAVRFATKEKRQVTLIFMKCMPAKTKGVLA